MVDVRFRLMSNKVKINRDLIRLCVSYQKQAFSSLAGIRMERNELIQELASSYLVVPIKMDDKGGFIDTNIMEMIKNFSIQEEANKRHTELISKRRFVVTLITYKFFLTLPSIILNGWNSLAWWNN